MELEHQWQEMPVSIAFDQVGGDRLLRTSALFAILQNGIIHQMEPGAAVFRAAHLRGLLLVLIQQYIRIHRLPAFQETVRLRSRPGRKMHMLFPLFCEITGEDGSVLVESNAVWALIGGPDRSLVPPEDYGLEFPYQKSREPVCCMDQIKPLPLEHQFQFVVPRSYIDLNGHMNNTRYFDMVEDHTPPTPGPLREVRVEFVTEALLGEELSVHWGARENTRYFCGIGSRGTCFQMRLEYADGISKTPSVSL